MREGLKEIGVGIRQVFVGEFIRFGYDRARKGNNKDTILLKNIKDSNGNQIADHVWLTHTQALKELPLKTHNVVRFEAQVETYIKGGARMPKWNAGGHTNMTLDYKLVYPTNITIVK